MEKILKRMAELFRAGERLDWANSFERFIPAYSIHPDLVASEIRTLFGGMGSLNDIVLHKEGMPLIDENLELDKLRAQLYELCQIART